MIKSSFDAVKVQAVAHEIKEGTTKLIELGHLGIGEMKQHQSEGN